MRRSATATSEFNAEVETKWKLATDRAHRDDRKPLKEMVARDAPEI
jgi:hypothetical protein